MDSLTVLGCRGSFPMIGTESVCGINTSSFMLETDSGLYLFDAGTGLGSLLREKRELLDGRDVHMLLSHVHLDHVAGLFRFFPLGDIDCRVYIYGAVRHCMGIREQLDRLMGPPYWPIQVSAMGGSRIVFRDVEPGIPFEAGGRKCTAVPTNHPDGCTCYRLEPADGQPGGSVFYGLDCEMTPECMDRLADFAKGTDIAILDSHFSPEDLKDRRGWGHSSYVECLGFAVRAGIGTTILAHFSPQYSDEQLAQMEAGAHALFSNNFLFAKEGMRVELA